MKCTLLFTRTVSDSSAKSDRDEFGTFTEQCLTRTGVSLNKTFTKLVQFKASYVRYPATVSESRF